VTNAVVVFVADFGLASAVAVRAPAAAGLVSAFVLAAAVVVAEPVVAVVSGPDLIFAARAPAGFVSAFGLAAVVAAERDVAVASGLALIFFERAPAAVAAFVPAAVAAFVPAAVAAFVPAAFHVDRAFALFALPAVLAAHRPLC